MTPEEFKEWLNLQIGFAISNENGERACALAECREKYLSILPSSTINK